MGVRARVLRDQKPPKKTVRVRVIRDRPPRRKAKGIRLQGPVPKVVGHLAFGVGGHVVRGLIDADPTLTPSQRDAAKALVTAGQFLGHVWVEDAL
jgi:hypothetical protein